MFCVEHLNTLHLQVERILLTLFKYHSPLVCTDFTFYLKKGLPLEKSPERVLNSTQMQLDSLEVKSNTFNWHGWDQIDKSMCKDCFSRQWTETPSGGEGHSLFHQFSACITSLISTAQPWHVKWSGQSGPGDGGCTVSSAWCFGARSVKGGMCSPHNHLCKLSTTMLCLLSSCVLPAGSWYSLWKGYSGDLGTWYRNPTKVCMGGG